MSREVVRLSSDDTIHEALELLISNRVSALPVVDKKEHCIGILSTTDLIEFTRDVDAEFEAFNQLAPSSRSWFVESLTSSIGHESVGTYMSEDVETIELEAKLTKAAQVMSRNQVHHLPVVDHHNRLVGIISTMDILAEYADSSVEDEN